MTIPIVPWQDPGQSLIDLERIENPYVSVWWTAQSISGIPEGVMGWLVSQGWEITDVAKDTSTIPATYTYTLTKQGLQPWQVLYSLCNSYTIAANDARDANEFRYNQIVQAWSEMTNSTQAQFGAQASQQNASIGVYLADLDTYMDEVNALIDANQATLVADAQAATDELAAMLAKLVDLETNAAATSATAESSLADQSDFVTSLVADITAKLSELDSDYLSHISTIVDLLTTIDSDYSTHESTAEAFLTDLGATELARITEQFAATLSTQLQQLIDRGLYSSAVATDITARNTRDRDEQIQALNDRLAREQLDNEHKLYDQLQGLRQLNIGTRDKFYDQLLQLASLNLAAYDKEYAAQQDTSRASVSVRASLLGQLQDAVKGVLAGKERYATLTMQNASMLAEHRHKAIVEKMNEKVTRLEGWKSVHADNMRLMAYQLDERNKLLIGLFAFVERREDIGPEWKDQAAMIAALGDSAGGWITP